MPSARECAVLLLQTIPNLMRGLHMAMRQRKGSEEELSTLGQLRMLEMLRREPSTLSALASRHLVTPYTMSRSIDALVRKAWVARQPAPNDRRQVILTITDEGRAAVAAIFEQSQDTVTQLIEQLNHQERTQLYDCLNTLQTLLPRIFEPDTCAKRET